MAERKKEREEEREKERSMQELNPRVPRLSCHLSYDPSLLALNPDFPFSIFVWQLWRKIGRKAWDDFARDTVAL